jgi:regulator of cell morphogenesis and NO signaling
MLNPHQKLSGIAAENPDVAGVLRQLGVDCARSPDSTLEEACALIGLSSGEIAAIAEAAAAGDPCSLCWKTATMSGIIRHVVEVHHVFMRRELPRLQALLHRAVHAETAMEAALREVLDAFVGMKAEIEMHLLKEEEILFPMCHELESADRMPSLHCGSVRNPVGVMMIEHDNAKDALRRMSEATGGYATDEGSSPLWHVLAAGLAGVEKDLLRHIHEEDDILFPRIVALEDSLSGHDEENGK